MALGDHARALKCLVFDKDIYDVVLTLIRRWLPTAVKVIGAAEAKKASLAGGGGPLTEKEITELVTRVRNAARAKAKADQDTRPDATTSSPTSAAPAKSLTSPASSPIARAATADDLLRGEDGSESEAPVGVPQTFIDSAQATGDAIRVALESLKVEVDAALGAGQTGADLLP